MPSIFPKNHLSKDPQTCNAFIGQMQLNMRAIKCMCCCSDQSALSCSSDSFITRHHRSQAQQKWSRLLDRSPRGPLLLNFQSFSDKTVRLQEKKKKSSVWRSKNQCWATPGIITSISQCIKREKEKEGRKKLEGNITTLQHCVSSSVQFCSFSRSCQALCNPMDCSTPGFSVHHQIPELAQIHVHRIGDAIQPSHPLSSPSPPAFNLSHHQGLFQWVSSSHQVAKVLEFQLLYQSFQWIFRTDFL